MSDKVRAALAAVVEGKRLSMEEARLAMGSVMDGWLMRTEMVPTGRSSTKSGALMAALWSGGGICAKDGLVARARPSPTMACARKTGFRVTTPPGWSYRQTNDWACFTRATIACQPHCAPG